MPTKMFPFWVKEKKANRAKDQSSKEADYDINEEYEKNKKEKEDILDMLASIWNYNGSNVKPTSGISEGGHISLCKDCNMSSITIDYLTTQRLVGGMVSCMIQFLFLW